MTLGPLLRTLRTRADLTLEQLSEASGVSGRAISDMERGVSRGPQARTIQAIADALRLGPEDRSALLAAARSGRHRGVPPGPLPVPRRLPDFTGRRRELAEVADRLAAGTAVVVSGAPGLGKTSLALEVAASAAPRYPDGVLWVDLRGLDPRPLPTAAVLERLVRAVDPAVRVVPREVADAAALWRSTVAGRAVLVVLDNAADEAQVRGALPADGPAGALVTSRRALSGLEGVARLSLDPLPPEESVDLLGRILGGPVPGPTPGPAGELATVARLCANVPLALRIAGNRLASRPGWTAADLVARLAARERRLDALAAGDLQVKAAFGLSYQQLSDLGRRLFRRLALVRGPSTGVELAAVLAGEPVPATEDALDELVELGLVQSADGGRVQFHDLLRLYAQAELDREEDPGERAAAAARADDWLLATTILAGRWYEPGFGAPDADPDRLVRLDSAADAAAWLKTEADNWYPAVLAAAAAGRDQQVLDVAESLHWFSDGWARWPHWPELFTAAAAAAGRLGDDRQQATQLGYLAWAHIYCLDDPAGALPVAARAYEVAVRAGDRAQQGWARLYASAAYRATDRPVESFGSAAEAAELLAAAGEREGRLNALMCVGAALRDQGRYAEALAPLETVLAELHDPATALVGPAAQMTELSTRHAIALLRLDVEDWAAALATVDAGLSILDQLENPLWRGWFLELRAAAHAGLGDRAAAAGDLRAALAALTEIGDETGVRRVSARLAD